MSNLSIPKLTVECEVALNCALLKSESIKSERKMIGRKAINAPILGQTPPTLVRK